MTRALLVLSIVAACQPFSEEIVPDSPGSWSTRTPLTEQRFEAYAATDGDRLYLLGGIVGDNVEPLRSAAFESRQHPRPRRKGMGRRPTVAR